MTPCYELVALRPGATAALGEDWPRTPGAARRAAGRTTVLHFASARWLLPEPAAQLLDAVRCADGCVLVDVSGKWRRVSLPSAAGTSRSLQRDDDAARSLRRAVDVEAVLAGRDCAALTLFDCPLILCRGEQELELWVQSSYCDSFLAMQR